MESIKTFEELRDYLWEERQDLAESLIDTLDETTEFDRGNFHGQYIAYSSFIRLLRDILKYGDAD